jgi:hypothetical protein
MKADLPEVGLRHFAGRNLRAELSSPGGEIVLTPRLLFHFFFLALAVVVIGCSKPDDRQRACPRPEPAFRIQLTAEQGPLPEDTYLRVFYQGKPGTDPGMPPHEDYDVRRPPTANVDVCCRIGDPVSGKLPAVQCGLPAAPDASTKSDAAPVLEAGSDGSDGARRDASLASQDAASDAAPIADSGTNASAPGALLCDLWTNGPAEIVVTGATYPRLEKTLSVELDECGVVRRDVRVIWARHDGGQ